MKNFIILVDVLKGELGVKTRRWGKGEKASDQEWVDFFLERMKQFGDGERTAGFICCAALVGPEGKRVVFEGRTEGIITPSLEAPIREGLALSSCFKPNGFDKVYAALSAEEKHGISHRGKALVPIRDFLLNTFSEND